MPRVVLVVLRSIPQLLLGLSCYLHTQTGHGSLGSRWYGGLGRSSCILLRLASVATKAGHSSLAHITAHYIMSKFPASVALENGGLRHVRGKKRALRDAA